MSTQDEPAAPSPAATGPGGGHFEGQVGAHYLLSMLVGAEPRGLPGTTIERVEFQRAGEGKPLDDVIVHARDQAGHPAEMEIQVKRGITFAPTDPVFKAVVEQIAEASKQTGFWETRHELAIAAAKSSRKIDGAYQDVLKWAREIGSHEIFMARIGRKGAASDDMRSFVRTFGDHLKDAGCPHGGQDVWRLLRRVRILPFDYACPGSASEELAKERAVRALHPDEAAKAASLWTHLTDLSMQIAIAGGDRTPASLAQGLAQASFRLAGERRHTKTRATLAEDSGAALADIGDRVGNVTLARTARLEAVRLALDRGRYVEIRGDSGVGKSGILKHLAEEVAAESRIVVLSPGRTAARWAAMRTELGFDGTAKELLSELANDGGSIMFVDNIDFFGEDERNTVVDLLRAASETPGISVVATARRNFGLDEPSWLPDDAVETLGRGGVVDIGELHETEIAELRHAAPKLAPLLAERHPARDVARNLYRLARLASRSADSDTPRTEVDMAEQWWRTADGKEDGRRERTRVLRALADHALATSEPLVSPDLPAAAIDELIASETVRDLGANRISFRHDVLREWAIANLLVGEPDAFDRLPLQRPAPPALARGVELAARVALERGSDAAGWNALLQRLSADGVHGTWRRAVLLALIRSEIAGELLDRASELLLADDARLLRELIRTTMAVDAEPANEFLAAIGMDPKIIPSGLDIPRGPSWQRLISWLIGLGENLPAPIIPDVVDLYTAWSSGMIGLDPITPTLLPWLYRWLVEIEGARDADLRGRREPFGGAIDYDKLRDLESSLRTGFLFFCQRTPKLAADYIRLQLGRQRAEQVVQGIMKFRGSLAQAAPAELAELTAAALIPKKRRSRRDRYDMDGPFGFADHDFLPESPAQGPFLELLTQSPQHGLALVKKLIDHAIAHYGGGADPGSDAIVISFPNGDRAFPWTRSYSWPRIGSNHYSLTSALMAIEAWAHKRIEAGEDFGKVLSDVLGPPESPAAYLLIAVDLILSHWPKSREAAVPFVSSPELLCIDRNRSVTDGMNVPNLLGLKEPMGGATADSLRKRLSRRLSLDVLIGKYAIEGPDGLRAALANSLRTAAGRLGAPDEQADLSDPAFMVQHALNLVDPTNWLDTTVALADGSTVQARQYRSPDTEAQHLGELQAAGADHRADSAMEARLSLALEDPSRSSPEFAVAAVEWAKRAVASLPQGKEDDWAVRMREQSIATAAMVAMRDGAESFRAEQRQWAEGIFARAIETGGDRMSGQRSTLRFNSIAIAFAGMIQACRNGVRPGDIRHLLEVAARHDPSAAPGFGATLQLIVETDERLVRSILRCAFAASLRTTRERNLSQKELAARAESRTTRLGTVVDAEIDWIEGRASEQAWPSFPSNTPRVRRGIRLPGGTEVEEAPPPRSRVEEYADHQSAALWLGNARGVFDVTARPWMRDLARAYSEWTAAANGAGLDPAAQVDSKPREWNDVYFELLSRCLPGISVSEVDALALDLIRSFPDESFYDAAATFLRDVDTVYFDGTRLAQQEAVRIRTVLAARLMDSGGWRWNARRKSTSIEMHIGPAIAVFYFNDYGHFQPTKSYLFEKGVDRLLPFLPLLERLGSDAPCLFIAMVALNLFEVSPRPEHAPFVVSAAKGWVAAFPDDTDFWINHGVGRRVSALLDKLFVGKDKVTDEGLRTEVDAILAALVKVGVAEASRLETALAAGK